MGNGTHTRQRAINKVREGLVRRYAAERRFRRYGMLAVFSGLVFLVIMFTSIISNGHSAFRQHYVRLTVEYDESRIDMDDPAASDFEGVVKEATREMFPWMSSRRDKQRLYGLISGDATYTVRDRVTDNLSLIGKREELWVLLDDDADMFFKGYITPVERRLMLSKVELVLDGDQATLTGDETAFAKIVEAVRGNLRLQLAVAEAELENASRLLVGAEARKEGRDEVVRARSKLESLQTQVADLKTRILSANLNEEIGEGMSSHLINVNDIYFRINAVTATSISGVVFVKSTQRLSGVSGQWQLITLETPVADRRLSDKEISVLLSLQDQGRIEGRFNSVFFNAGDSREPEQSGILGALKGSMYMLIVTLLLSFPIGVAAAVYLEEFAPQNRWTDFIEVNINNLAAVPSIVFGLLGLAVFINFFGLPRSAPLVGGLVLTLMTLPTIIISGRAALKSIPPSIREAALGVGASKVQTVFYHVLPLALPGMLTGTIIGMAQALGESAPLLMIGMVAFIVDVPQSFTDPATALPVQIYLWADSPERAFVERTSAAIMVLLGFLITMNALAVVLRKRFERRW